MKCSNGEEIWEICQEQEEEENWEGTSTLPRNADSKRMSPALQRL